MPQEIGRKWQESLGEEYSQVHQTWLHTLGNLTLTAYNSEQSNKPFKEKLQFIRESNLKLNQNIADLGEWTEEQIQKRANDLADIAISIWPR